MNDLYYIKYKPELMLCDTMDMSPATDLAHRRLCDFIWRQSKGFKFNDAMLAHFTKCPLELWPAVWTELQEKGWMVAGDYVIHKGAIESHNAAQREYAAECNQTAAATSKKTGKPIAASKCVTDAVTGIVTIVVTVDVANRLIIDAIPPKYATAPKPRPTTKPETATVPLLAFPMLDRVCREIVNNTHSWHYDNHKLRPDELVQGGLIGALRPFVGRITEKQAHEAWQEAATRTHRAVVDEMAIADRAKYAVACWKDQMTNVAEKGNGKKQP